LFFEGSRGLNMLAPEITVSRLLTPYSVQETVTHKTHQRTADFISTIGITTGADRVSEWMDQLEKSPISIAPWPAFPYTPEVSFTIAHSSHHLLLKYFVTEKHVRALYKEANDPVHKDSCVEFFIAFGGESNYYNLEFNCVGTCQAAFGAGKNGRIMIDRNIIHKIRWHMLMETASIQDDRIRWELTLMIPFDVFCFHNLTTLKGMSCRANFYKCGDDLPDPHFLTWNNISGDEPDFHQPEYFGSIHFRHPETDPLKHKPSDL
jgi:hypothetical protein